MKGIIKWLNVTLDYLKISVMSVFFRLPQNAFFKYTYFNRLLAVRVRVIMQLAKVLWSRKDEIFHSFWL